MAFENTSRLLQLAQEAEVVEDFATAIAHFESAAQQKSPHTFEAYQGALRCIAALEQRVEQTYLKTHSIAPMFLTTQHCSGSHYFAAELARGLKLVDRSPFNVANTFNHLVFRTLIERGGVAWGHLTASKPNLAILEKFGVRKLIVHVRDPRQTPLSFLHFQNEVIKNPEDSYENQLLSARFKAWRPANSNSWSFEQSVDYILRLRLSLDVAFITDWMNSAYSDQNKIEFHFTRFDDLKSNYQLFFRTLLEFLEIDPARFEATEPVPTKGIHRYRSGQLDEWRSVYTPAQLKIANDAVPDSLLSHFGWER